jgi:phi LC3 family holin
MDLKARFRNKAFLIALVSAILLLLKNFGLGKYIPENIDSIVNGFITIGILLGVITDTSTPGISDQVVSDATVKTINSQEQVKKEDLMPYIEKVLVDNGIVFDSKGMSATGSLKVTSQDDTSQITVNDSSINTSVQPTDTLNASAKIEVYNPEKIEDGKNVEAVSAAAPTN